MNEKMNGGISTMRGIFCRLSFQKGGITAETIAAQGFDGGIFSVDTRHVGASFISLAPTFFQKVRAHSFRCSSFSSRKRSAGLRLDEMGALDWCIFFVNIVHVKPLVSLK